MRLNRNIMRLFWYHLNIFQMHHEICTFYMCLIYLFLFPKMPQMTKFSFIFHFLKTIAKLWYFSMLRKKLTCYQHLTPNHSPLPLKGHLKGVTIWKSPFYPFVSIHFRLNLHLINTLTNLVYPKTLLFNPITPL